MALQTLIITAVLVLVAVVAGVIFIAQGESANEDLIGQAPSIDSEKCNEVEVYNHELAVRGIRGTNGPIMNFYIDDGGYNLRSQRDQRNRIVDEIRSNYASITWLDLKPTEYYNHNRGEHWLYTDQWADAVGRLQGSAPGCVPVCFWLDDGDQVAESGEFYYNYNTHPKPGIGLSPHHRGSLLATPTHEFIDYIPPAETTPFYFQQTYFSETNQQFRLNQELNFPRGSSISGVRVEHESKSCNAYDEAGNTLKAKQADPIPYELEDHQHLGISADNISNCPAGSTPGCKMYNTDDGLLIMAQGYLGGLPGHVCADGQWRVGRDSYIPPCHLFPYTHARR